MPSCQNSRQTSYRTSLFTLWTPCCASAIQKRISSSIALSPKDRISTFGAGEVRTLWGRLAASRVPGSTPACGGAPAPPAPVPVAGRDPIPATQRRPREPPDNLRQEQHEPITRHVLAEIDQREQPAAGLQKRLGQSIVTDCFSLRT